jgi:hypothetical protein
VLVLEVSTDINLGMLLKRLDLVEEASPLLVLHWNCGVTTAIDDSDSILVCLSIVCHKSLELRLRDTVPCHYGIEVLPKYTLSNRIL